jgi:mannose-6-phosphate isomerase
MDTGGAELHKLTGTIRKYDWGGTDFLARLFSVPNPAKERFAEYWLGAHHLAPSTVDTSEGRVNLATFAGQDAAKILGPAVASRFGRLPFLLKVLDVRGMLSIQVHPGKHEAEVEFARENHEGIPLNAPERNYKDDNHKPELMAALGDFWLLHGFKPTDQIVETLRNVPEFAPLLQVFESLGLDQLYKTVMEMPQESVNRVLQPVMDRIIPLYSAGRIGKNDANFWAARAGQSFQHQNDRGQNKIDRGIFSIYLFQAAGMPHAYLEGQNVEIMANSDNVLRAGLTTKHVDVKELMKHVKFEETLPHILKGEKLASGERIYRTVAPDFQLSRFRLDAEQSSAFRSQTGEILLLLEGSAAISSSTGALELQAGEAAFLGFGQAISIQARERIDLYRATVPMHATE